MTVAANLTTLKGFPALIDMSRAVNHALANSATQLEGQWAVVTGSSRGIGRAIALEFATAGANVIVHGGCNREAAERVGAEVRKLGRETQVVLADVTASGRLAPLVKEIWQQRPIDIWVNNAGADVLTGDAANWSFTQKLETLWQTDVAATIELSRQIGKRMKSRGCGAILNVGWDQAELGMEGDSGEMFAAAKGAIMTFTRSLAKSLAPEVRVNCLAPGWIRTGWGDQASEYWQRRATQESLLQRWGTPEDVAQAAAFLASPAASFITGHVLPINGGFAGSH